MESTLRLYPDSIEYFIERSKIVNSPMTKQESSKGQCPCCGQEVKVKVIPAKWVGQKDQVVIEQEKWAENWK